jgi:hypothetical protein
LRIGQRRGGIGILAAGDIGIHHFCKVFAIAEYPACERQFMQIAALKSTETAQSQVS